MIQYWLCVNNVVQINFCKHLLFETQRFYLTEKKWVKQHFACDLKLYCLNMMVWLLAMTCVAWFLQMAIQRVVNPVDKMKFDQMFKIADTDMDGFVSGDEIRSIFLQSGLPNTTLAHIWWVTT